MIKYDEMESVSNCLIVVLSLTSIVYSGFFWNLTEATQIEIACCCPTTNTNCGTNQLNPSCSSPRTVEVIGITHLYTATVAIGQSCPTTVNMTSSTNSTLIKDDGISQYIMVNISGVTKLQNPFNLPPCGNNTYTKLVALEYQCIDNTHFATLCENNAKAPAHSIGLWTQQYPYQPLNSTIKSCVCDVIISSSNQIEITTFDNKLHGSQITTLQEYGGRILNTWNSTVYLASIGEKEVLNITYNKMVVRWENPNKENGSMWIGIKALSQNGTVQVTCKGPGLHASVTNNPTGTGLTIGPILQTGTNLSTGTSALSSNLSPNNSTTGTNKTTNGNGPAEDDQSSNGSLWYIGLIVGLLLLLVILVIIGYIVWKKKKDPQKVRPEDIDPFYNFKKNVPGSQPPIAAQCQ